VACGSARVAPGHAAFRFDRSEARSLIGICDNNHDYTPEQAAYDSGLLDQFV
jgi:hypothetical protein